MDDNNKKQYMQFRYGDRELQMGTDDLLDTNVEVIVSPASCDLAHDRILARRIITAAGEQVLGESRQLINEYGRIDSGMAVYTAAGKLPYRAIVHAVCAHDDDEPQQRIEQAISRSLLLCEANEWKSIAFPAIGSENDESIDISAQAFFRAITSFWDARGDCAVEKIILCLTPAQFRPFFDAFRNDAITEPPPVMPVTDDREPVIGIIDLSESDLAELDDDEIADWFK